MTFTLTNYNNLLLTKVSKNREERNKDCKFLCFVTEMKQEISEIKKDKETLLISDLYIEEDKHVCNYENPNIDEKMTRNGRIINRRK